MYRQIYGLSQLASFAGFEQFFMTNFDDFKSFFDSQTPHLSPLPEPWDTKLNDFQKLIILKAIRSDKVVQTFTDIYPPFNILTIQPRSSRL